MLGTLSHRSSSETWLACFVVSTPSLELVQLSGSNDKHNLRLDDVNDGKLRATKSVRKWYNETDALK